MTIPQLLTEQMSWSELADYTINKLARFLEPSEHKTFKAWFLKREHIGHFFDYGLILRCFRICQEVENNLDHFIVIVGREGLGKSTLSFQIAAWINPNFVIEHICYGAKAYLDILRKKARIAKLSHAVSSSLVLDEGTELLSREIMNATNRALIKTFHIQRALKTLVIINIPNFFMLDPAVRQHRVRTLIEIKDRGVYKMMLGNALELVDKEGRKTKRIGSVRLKPGTYWNGYFRSAFPLTIDRGAYEAHKLKGIRDTLEEMRFEVVETKLIPVSRVAKQVGVTNETVVSWIQKGIVSGKQIGGQYFIPKLAYDLLMTTSDKESLGKGLIT